MTAFLASSGSFIYILAAFVVALSIIVAVHEFGHYIVGRWCGIGAEVFSVGFGPVLWSRTDRRGTKWQIAALPFGGYVKFNGDANAASVGSTEDRASAPRDTMLGAPLWARALTVAAGPVFNFILSMVVFAAVMLGRGEALEPLTVSEIRPLPEMVQELEPGDRVMAIAGLEAPAFEAFDRFIDALPVDPTLEYEVERQGERVTVRGPYPYPARVAALTPRSAAIEAGLGIGDVITGIDGEAVHTFEDLKRIVAAAEGETLSLTVWRPTAQGAEELAFELAPRRMDIPGENGFETRWLIGVTGGLFFAPETQSPGLFEALWGGTQQVWFIITSSLTGLWSMITGAISSCNLSGPIGIAETSGAMASQGAVSFVWFLAVLSTAVGLLNLFPVPILDGGHLVFHAYEAVSGRPPSDRALRVLMSVGLTLILGLMFFAVFNDLFCP